MILELITKVTGFSTLQARVLSVYTMSRDRHKIATRSHDIAKHRHVTVINIRTVKGDNVIDLTFKTLSHCFNTEDFKQLANIVGRRSMVRKE